MSAGLAASQRAARFNSGLSDSKRDSIRHLTSASSMNRLFQHSGSETSGISLSPAVLCRRTRQRGLRARPTPLRLEDIEVRRELVEGGEQQAYRRDIAVDVHQAGIERP